jgi:hypothetical protein
MPPRNFLAESSGISSSEIFPSDRFTLKTFPMKLYSMVILLSGKS